MRLLIFVFLAAGCGTTRNSFFDDYAQASCKVVEKCDQEVFDDTYDNVGECVEEITAYFTLFLSDDCLDTCEYSGADANKCLGSVRGMSCDEYDAGDYDSSCNEVWDCSDGDPEACGYYSTSYYTLD